MARFPNLSLSVVIPAYNEADRLGPVIRRAVQSLQGVVGVFEILLIDDCSTDGTPAVADALGREFPQVRVFHNARNLKQGGCLSLGFGKARYDLITHNAVDYPFDFEDLVPVLDHFPGADVVVVTRQSYPGVSLGRRFVSWVNRTLIRLLFGVKISDYNFVQVYAREALMQDESFSTGTAFITVERIIRAHAAGRRVVAVDAEYHPRTTGKSSSGTVRVVCDSLRDMCRLWWQLRLKRSRRGAFAPGGKL
jgi:glycosyltransferase involved in cell wall biosynthesis